MPRESGGRNGAGPRPAAVGGGDESSSFARERVRQAIRTGIAQRTMLPGQQVPEMELATWLGVSRTPVREALRELEQQGLVVSYPHRGSFIRTFTAKDIEDLVYVRAAVEGMAAWQAVEQASRAQVRGLEHILAEMETSDPEGGATGPNGPEATGLVDLRFHEALVALSGNVELARVWQQADPLIRTLQAHRLRPHEQVTSSYLTHLVGRHRQIVEALLSGDAARAEHEARSHVIDAGLRVTADMRRVEAAGRVAGGTGEVISLSRTSGDDRE